MAKPIILADSILGALPSELSRRLFAQGRLSSLDADQTLFLAGDEGDGCYRVEEGLLKASVAAPNGGERILAVLGPRSVVGELSMIDARRAPLPSPRSAIPNCALSAKPISTQSGNPARKSTATL
jgi:CRP/FNR family cyclic AMP-dependent transcriptional regulator